MSDKNESVGTSYLCCVCHKYEKPNQMVEAAGCHVCQKHGQKVIDAVDEVVGVTAEFIRMSFDKLNSGWDLDSAEVGVIAHTAWGVVLGVHLWDGPSDPPLFTIKVEAKI